MRRPLKTLGTYLAIILLTLLAIELGSFGLLVGYGFLAKGLPIGEAISERIEEHPLRSRSPRVETGFNPLTQTGAVARARWTGLTVNDDGYVDNGHDDPLLNSYPDKPEGLVRVVILGGSSAAGVTANDNTETIAASLERMLNASAPEPLRFQVLNFGVPGSYLFAEVGRYLSHVTHLEPDIAVFFDGYNDALYAAFEHRRQHLDVPLMNWADYSYGQFDTWNNLGVYRRSPPPVVFTYAYVLAQRLFEKYGLAGMLERQRAERAQAYESHYLYRFSRRLRAEHPFYENAAYENLDFLASYHIGKQRLFLAYLQAVPLEHKDLAAEREAGLDILRAPVSEAIDPALNDLFRKDVTAAFRRFGDVYQRLDAEFLAYPNIRFFDIRRLFESTTERVYNDIVHTNALGNEIIARRMHADILGALSHLGLAMRPS